MTALYEKMRLENMKHFGFGPEVMKSIKVCKECGAKVNSELLFCPECDRPLPTETLYTLYVHSHFVCTKCKRWCWQNINSVHSVEKNSFLNNEQ